MFTRNSCARHLTDTVAQCLCESWTGQLHRDLDRSQLLRLNKTSHLRRYLQLGPDLRYPEFAFRSRACLCATCGPGLTVAVCLCVKNYQLHLNVLPSSRCASILTSIIRGCLRPCTRALQCSLPHACLYGSLFMTVSSESP